jgi:hypothetical protein
LNDKAALNSYKREFLEHVKNRLHGEFDRGFFLAWADCMRVLSKINIAAMPNANSPSVKNETEKGKIEALPNEGIIEREDEENA